MLEDTPRSGGPEPGFLRRLAGRALVLCLLAPGCGPGSSADVTITRPVADSMNATFRESNKHWDELQDLTTLERMLGTVRPTQREFLGCLQGRMYGDRARVTAFVPARNMRRLQMAVTGSCDSLPDVIGAWHTHPYHADAENRAVKAPALSPQDLETFEADSNRVMLVVWDVDSMDLAIRREDGSIVHPATVKVIP